MYAGADRYVVNLLNTVMTSDVVLKLTNEYASGFAMMTFCCAQLTAGGQTDLTSLRETFLGHQWSNSVKSVTPW